MSQLLRIENLETYYGQVYALKGISLEADSGSIVTVLGANGAGKSTLLRTISGLISPSGGTIEFGNRRIDGLRPHKVVKLGISQVPEGRELFPELTVLENLRMGAFCRKSMPEIASDLSAVYNYFPILNSRADQIASTLSGGEQQMLAIGRALMSRPKLLLLDEPSLGLAPLIVQEIYGIVRRINTQGMTVLLVEQNANLGLSIAGHGYVLETGKIAVHGKSEALLENEHVKKAYLGN
ncbi:MAG: ABC transporter ATP-binding protein [Desulfatiglandaceae bacterium]